jgi:hypothetical protein
VRLRLENRLYPPPSDLPSDDRPQPDWAVVHRELRRPSVTLMLLWEEYCDTTLEYCDTTSDGFSYSWFCERYRESAGRLKPTLRQVHVAGEKLFVDYSGRTMEVIDGLTGEVLTAQIFVAVLGASNFTYAEATFTRNFRLPRLHALLLAVTQTGLLRHRAQDDQEADGATAKGNQDGVAQKNARLHRQDRRVAKADAQRASQLLRRSG